MNVIYISNNLNSSASGAGAVSFSNLLIVKEVAGNCHEVRVEKLIQQKTGISIFSRIATLFFSLLGFSGGLGPKRMRDILNMQEVKNCDCIWLDSSLYGRLVKQIKNAYPSKKVITFFHNVEFDFMRVLAKNRGFLFYPILKSSCYNEMLAVKYSDYILTLTNEDSIKLNELYGRAADLVLPVSFDSTVGEVGCLSSDLLFVGSDFPPNVEALKFLASKVMPFVDRTLTVIGKGMEKYSDDYNSSNIQVLGYVEDVTQYYQMCNIVLTPIFSGAGMKVKVAEALSFGKIILGTEFSFVGYEKQDGIEEFLICAETSEEYIELLQSTYPSYCNNSKNYFDNNYSSQNNNDKIKKLLSDMH